MGPLAADGDAEAGSVVTHMVAVILWLITGLDVVRQQRVALHFALDNNLTICGLARDPQSAVALVGDHAAEGVLVAVEPHPAALDVIGAVRLYVARRAVVRVDAETRLIMTALKNSRGDVQLVAELLGLDRAQVAALARAG